MISVTQEVSNLLRNIILEELDLSDEKCIKRDKF